MATPTTNAVSTTSFDRDDTDVPWLVWNAKWGGALGTGVTLPYSFSLNAATFVGNYGEGVYDEPAGIRAMTTHERNACVSALNVWSSIADIHFVATSETTSNVGEIRFGVTTNNPGRTGHAYLPDPSPEAGDIWFNPANWNDALTPGSFDYYVILHEIGHAMGLEHSFDDAPVAPAKFDNHLYTIMAYRAGPNSPTGGGVSDFYPTTPMFYDMLAMQSMYGRNLTANAGATIYAFNANQKYFQTIYDSGGVDTITYSGAAACKINLNIGAFSEVGKAILFENTTNIRATVCIGPSTIIENATGGSGNDRLIGNSAANVLNGGAGGDTMLGGAGNDTYIVNSPGSDVVMESAGKGLDTVKSSFSYTLGANLENLILVGTGSSALKGNGLDNVITGNAKANTIDGAGGDDHLIGGGGNDVYIIQSSAADTVVEAASGGIDTVKTYFSATLSANVENLTLIGTGASSLTGNTLANVITGNARSNTLTGGAGADAFVFNSALASNNIDKITDFAPGQDEIRLENAIFTTLSAGALGANQFHIGAAAADASDRIIYNDATGALSYDADGDGAGAAIQFATLGLGLALNEADFAII